MSETTATKDDVLVYGSSDDILCVMGQGLDEEFYPKQDEDEADYLALSDGTLLKVVYDGREFARVMVPVFPGEARRLGVRVRNR